MKVPIRFGIYIGPMWHGYAWGLVIFVWRWRIKWEKQIKQTYERYDVNFIDLSDS